MRIVYLLLSLMLLSQSALFAQIGISGSPHPSAVLDLKSPANDKAFYPPRLTSTQRLAIPNPQVGAFVYDLDKGTMYLYDGQNWLPLLTTDPSLLAPIGRTADDGAANDYFGNSVAIAGDYAIIGAYYKTIGSNNRQGAAYVFVRSGNSWTQQQRLTADDGAAGDFFGGRVAIAGDYAIVGTSYKVVGSTNSRQGAAYVFVRSGNSWTQQQRLTADDGAAGDFFGGRVAIAGDYAIVGTSYKVVGSTNSRQGAAYVFVRSGNSWTQQQRLTADDGATNDFFGTGVAIVGDCAIVGAPNKTVGNNSQQGAAYVFVRSGNSWTQQQLLTASDGAAGDSFGGSIDISESYAILGAYNKTIGSNNFQGAAYVFLRSGAYWIQQQRLTASDGATSDSFGNSVAIAGDYAIVGAPNKTIGSNSYQGAAYIFTRSGTGWGQQQGLTAGDGVAGDSFGRSVSISGNYAIVGADSKTISNIIYQGAAYVFMRNSNSWSQQRVTDNSPPYTQDGSSVGLSNGTFIIGGQGFQNHRGKISFGTVN